MFDVDRYLAEHKTWAEQILEKTLPNETERPEGLHKAMRYAVLAGGKRLRPILCRACAEAAGGTASEAGLPGAAIELLHTYTLIHDDLPAMDNDDLRRGQPTVHKAFGEANAILAGDSLLTLAFELLAACPAPAPHPSGRLSLELAQAAGSRALAGGQFEDLAAEHAEPDAERLDFIHLNKTARLIEASCRIGAISAGADEFAVESLGGYGRTVGMAFQTADDILNATSNAEALGKASGSDREREKLTAVSVYGLDGARDRAQRFIAEAGSFLDGFPNEKTEPLRALATYTLSRNT